ncbi:MAG: peptidylprolyl isomerase [Clostridia bacterium]|nr:peptidylprolyl isomerase [Clostridia bacterium]
MKKWMILTALVLMLCLLTGCGNELELDDGDGPLYQYTMPEEGAEIAVIHTSMGDITVRFFPEQAPKAVKNFLGLAKEGYYNGTKFHRVINEFMIQAGSPNGDGSSGESIYGKGFETETSPLLHHLHGALAMANTGLPDSNQAQWYIIQYNGLAMDYQGDRLAQKQKTDPVYGYTQKVIDSYKNDGGVPGCDGRYTVFGQVISGLDVVDRIGRMRTDENDRPVEDIIVTSVEVTTYHAD